jgi:hypothetical protein
MRKISRKGWSIRTRILRDYTPNIDDLLVDEDIVPSAWRHAGANVKGTRRSLYVVDSHGERPISEIPCRVSNIARGGGNTVSIQPAQIGGAHTMSAGTSRVIPRVRSEAIRIPVTTRGLRALG